MVRLDHPANLGVISYLAAPERLGRSASVAAQRDECAPSDVPDPYYSLGTHPDLVARLWDELASGLPADCRRILFGTPVLVRPDSGVLFTFAGGTHTYALRVPPEVKGAALAAGATTVHHYPAYPELGIQASVLDRRDVGDEWIFGGWLAAGRRMVCRGLRLRRGLTQVAHTHEHGAPRRDVDRLRASNAAKESFRCDYADCRTASLRSPGR